MHHLIAIASIVVILLVLLMNAIGMAAWVAYQVLAYRFLHIPKHPVKKEKTYQPDLFPETLADRATAEVRHPQTNLQIWP